ncbi:MAG: DUF2207 domain-containing protein, partial [Anaerolineales bacterium]|nr:DUF2207 domain-containing protein [Anaerolineales bacterium]
LEEQTPYLLGRGAAQTFTQSLEGDTLFVDWEYAPTSPGDTLVFVLEYTVAGGLWVYPEATRLEWRAIPADRSGLAVPQSRVTVQLPNAVPGAALSADAFGPEYDVKIVENETNTTVIYQAVGDIADGTQFQVLLDFPPDVVTAVPQQWQIAEDSAALEYSIDQIEMDIVMQPDGTLSVVETQQVSVQAGILYSGFREFSLLFADDIQILDVREGDLALSQAEPGADCVDCYTIENETPLSWWASYSPVLDEVTINEEAAGAVLLNWFVPPLVAGESSQFTLAYEVAGTVRPTDAAQLLNWTAVSNYDVPLENVQVRWQLPNGLGLEDVQFSGGSISRTADGAILLSNDGPIAPNTPWQLELTLPPESTSAVVPAWQRKIEAEIAEGEAYRVEQARIDLAWLVGKILAGMTAVLGAIAYWYLRGSRRLREALGNYRTEPPSDLPPGVVNFLVEGKLTARGLLASVLHLADLGLLRLQMGDPLALTAVRRESIPAGSKIVTPAGDQVEISRFLSQLFNALLPHLPADTAVPLPTLLQTLPAHLPQLVKTMGEEMVTHFYGRSAWRAKYSQQIIGISMFAIFGMMILVLTTGMNSSWNRQIPVFMFGGMFLWFLIARAVSKKARSLTEQARAEKSKWLGFKAYLAEIQKFGDLAEGQEILDSYFAYAVALGVDDRLLAQIQQLGGHIPGWLQSGVPAPLPPVRRRSWQDRWRRRLRRGSWQPRPPRPAATLASQLPTGNGRPTLETISDGLAGGLERSSNQLADLLNTAVGPGKDGSSPDIVLNAAGQSVKLNWDDNQSLDGMMNDIMRKAQAMKPPRPASGGGRGGYRGGSGSSFGRSSHRSSSSRSRSSSSRRSGGGGRRGFR